jgi:hypothetical protein
MAKLRAAGSQGEVNALLASVGGVPTWDTELIALTTFTREAPASPSASKAIVHRPSCPLYRRGAPSRQAPRDGIAETVRYTAELRKARAMAPADQAPPPPDMYALIRAARERELTNPPKPPTKREQVRAFLTAGIDYDGMK